MQDFLDTLRTMAAHGPTQETAESVNLVLTKQQFVDKMKLEMDGNGDLLLDLLERGEWRIAERMGLIHGEQKDGEVVFTIPRWNNLVQHLRIVHSVC